MREDLQKKINQAIRLLQSLAPKDGSPIEVAYSGGKDSDVILQLVKESGIPYRAIYKNTTIDPIGTRKHVIEMGAEIITPTESFFKLVEKKGFPSRLVRFCCEALKEYKILNVSVIGVRKAESRKRSEIYKEPTICRYYGAKKESNKVKQIFPILEWSDDDVLDFIIDRKIKIHPLYYKQDGSIDIKKRLGCMGCPLQSPNKRIEEFKKNPKILKAWLIAGKKFMKNKPETATATRYNHDVYELMYRALFFKSQNEFQMFDKSNLFGKPKYKELLEEIFKTDLTI